MMATIQDSKLDLMLTPRVPQGLAAAVEGLTREVIRHRPENIYVFAAHHFEKLLRLREQYDDNTVHKKNMKFLHDINDAIRKRSVYLDSKKSKDFVQHSGWSLNETAKVLENHRSIFGESNKKISLDEIRELANKPILIPSQIHVSSHKKKYETQRVDNKNRTDNYAIATSSKRRESPYRHLQDSPRVNINEFRSAPKIISQIPLVKDIKTELKKNRISSRERTKAEEKKMQLAGEYSEYTMEKRLEKSVKKSLEKKINSFENLSEQQKNLHVDGIKRRSDTTKGKSESSKMKKSLKTSKMDEVRDYVIENIIGMTRLDELQSPSYVEKVQEVIDETSMIIKEKVEALKTGVIMAARAKHSKSENSSSNDECLKSSSRSDSGKKTTRRILFKSSSYQNLSKSGESSKIFQDNSENSESLGNNRRSSDQSELKIFENLDNSNEFSISLPAVRTPSSKSASRSLSARSNSDGLVLPPISPESSKSTKIVEKLILPLLSPPRSTSITPDSINFNEKIAESNQGNNGEEFHDSLNVTPELIDTTQRPDSLETSDIVDKTDSSGHISPLETLTDKLLEIEEVQKRIEDVLYDTANIKDENLKNEEAYETKVTSKIEDKLLEIQESEKRIEKILDFQCTAVNEDEVINTDIKSKLQELEDTERRIENIFITESSNEYLNNINTTKANIKRQDNSCIFENFKNINESNLQKDLDYRADTTCYNKSYNDFKNVERALSPHSYVLTEGSPYDIPDSITTVIIPDRSISPVSNTLQDDLEDGKIFSTLISSKNKSTVEAENYLSELQEEKKMNIHDAFGELVTADNMEISTVDRDYIYSIKMNHDLIARQELDQIQEERDKEVEAAEDIDSEDEKVLKVVTTSLEEILEKDKVEYVSKAEIQSITRSAFKEEANNYLSDDVQLNDYESTDETKETTISDGFVDNTEIIENTLDIEETTGRSAESTNEIKETSIATDRSSLSFDPVGPIVPELNLDSLPDLTVSSFNITDDEQKEENTNNIKNLDSSEACTISIDLKVNMNMNEADFKEKFTAQTDVNDLTHDHINIMETSKEDSSLELKKKSNEFLETLHTESTELDISKSNQISEEISVSETENITNDFNDETKAHNCIPVNTFVNSDIKIVNVQDIEDDILDEITNVCNEKHQSKKITTSTSESQNNLLVDQANKAESSLRELENELLHIERNHLRDIDTDQKSQFVDSSRVPSQCTKQQDSNDILTKTSIGNVIKNNHSQNNNPIQEQTIADKLINNFQVPDATALIEEVKNATTDEKKYCHIYMPDIGNSKDMSSSTGSSTFMSAATKIQAGVRGFLTRRRLQTSQRRSSTLDNIPSIEESLVVDNPIQSSSSSSSSYPMPVVKNTLSIFEPKIRKRLCREDAVQRTTLSLENAFTNNQLQHTGEFHDCIPLPVFDTTDFSFKTVKEQGYRDARDVLDFNYNQDSQKKSTDKLGHELKKLDDNEKLILHGESLDVAKNSNVNQLLEKILADSTTKLADASKLGKFVDAVLLSGENETMLQNRYLNFITSVEDVANDLFNDTLELPNSPQGIIIEEITSLDEDKCKVLESTSVKENENTTIDSVNAIDKKKTTNESVSEEIGLQSTQEKSSIGTSNADGITASQSFGVKFEESIESSVNISQFPPELESFDGESFEESNMSERRKADKEENNSPRQKTDNKSLETKEPQSLASASITFSDEVGSMNIEKILGLEDEDESLRKSNGTVQKPATTDFPSSVDVSQENTLGYGSTPLPMEQIVPDRFQEKSEKSESDKNKSSGHDEANKPST